VRKFTRAELARYNGSNGTPAYIVYEGKLYDVSNSFLWKDGSHQVLHQAGNDLTSALDEAPHGPELLQRFPVVGTLHED